MRLPILSLLLIFAALLGEMQTASAQSPTSYFFATGGGLIAYGPDLIDQYQQAAGYVDRILKGEKAADHTPPEIIDKLNREINAALADPTMQTRLADLGGTALAGSPTDFGKLIANETEKWAKVVKSSGAKAD